MAQHVRDQGAGNWGASLAGALIGVAQGRPVPESPTPAKPTDKIPAELQSVSDWSKVQGVPIGSVCLGRIPGKYLLIGTSSGNTYCVTRTANGDLACFNGRSKSGHLVNSEDLLPGRFLEVGKPGNFAGFSTSPIMRIEYTNIWRETRKD